MAKRGRKTKLTTETHLKIANDSMPDSATYATGQRTRKPLAKWRRQFLKAFCESGNVSASCSAVGIDRSTFYRSLKRSPAFAEQIEQAKVEAIGVLEDAAWERATSGQSDRILMFLLQSLKPDTYGRRQVEVTGPEGGPVRHAVAPDRQAMIDYSQDPEAMQAMAVLASKSATLALAAQEDDEMEVEGDG